MRTAGRLTRRAAPAADLTIRGARVLDPAEGIDAVLDVQVRDGVIVALGADAQGANAIDGSGKTLLPGLIDPHVHLRTPGQEWKEEIGRAHV